MGHEFAISITTDTGRWIFECTCGHSDERRRSQNERATKELCQGHLEQAHGVCLDDVRVTRRGRITTVTGIDMRILDEAEKDAYRSLMRRDLRLGDFLRLCAALVAWAGCVIGYTALVTYADQNNAPGQGLLVFGLIVLLLVIPIVICVKVGGRDARRARDRMTDEYLTSIRYAERTYRDDVTYRDGKAFRRILVSPGGDYHYRDHRGRLHTDHADPVYERMEVAYGDVPPEGEAWTGGDKRWWSRP